MDQINMNELPTTELESIIKQCKEIIEIRKQENIICNLVNLSNKLSKHITDITYNFSHIDYVIEENMDFKLNGINCSMYYQGDRSEFNPNIYVGDIIETEDDFEYWSIESKSNWSINRNWIQNEKKFKKLCEKYKVSNEEFFENIVEIMEYIRNK